MNEAQPTTSSPALPGQDGRLQPQDGSGLGSLQAGPEREPLVSAHICAPETPASAWWPGHERFLSSSSGLLLGPPRPFLQCPEPVPARGRSCTPGREETPLRTGRPLSNEDEASRLLSYSRTTAIQVPPDGPWDADLKISLFFSLTLPPAA